MRSRMLPSERCLLRSSALARPVAWFTPTAWPRRLWSRRWLLDKVASALRLPYAPVADAQHGAEWQEVTRDPASVDRVTRSADRLADQTLARVQEVSRGRDPERAAQGPDLPTSSPVPAPAQRPAPVSLEPVGPAAPGRSDR